MSQLKVTLNGSSYAVMAMLAETNNCQLAMTEVEAVFLGLDDYNGIEAYILSDNANSVCEIV